jgi:hypothetical protein
MRVPAECSLNDVVRIDAGMSRYVQTPQPFMTCPMVVAQRIFETQVIHPAAARHFGQEVIAIEHLGTYNCRRQNGKADGPMSEHAFANAFDISAIHIAKVGRVEVEKYWSSKSAEATFLKEIHTGACRIFSVSLGPDFNAAHANHFHLDLGQGSTCR